MNDYILGLDIGVASVGYGVIDKAGIYVDSGVRLFSMGSAEENKTRRENRQARRIKRRKQYRIKKFNNTFSMVIDENKETESYNNIVFLRCKGLEEELSTNELLAVLKNMLKHRGITYLDDIADEKSAETNYKKSISINEEELMKLKYPCLIQKQRLDTYGKYRGDVSVSLDGENILLRNVFTKASYVNEIRKILETNSQYHDFIDENFIEKYIEIFSYKRAYFEGPGCVKSRTNYGIYRTDRDENGELVTWKNIFANLIGKCSIFNDELRTGVASISAEVFNCLNDLNNIKISGHSLTIEFKQELFNYIWNKNANVTVNDVVKYINKNYDENVTLNNIGGLRIDTKETKLLHTLPTFHKVKKELLSQNLVTDEWLENVLVFSEFLNCKNETLSLYNKIMNVLTLNTEKSLIESELTELGVDEKFISFFAEFRSKNSSLFSKWHSLSVKAMEIIIPELYSTDEEQMTSITRLNLKKSDLELLKEFKEIPESFVTEEIYNPVVKKSIRQAIKITNALIKKYGEFSEIVIEMPREDDIKGDTNKAKKFNKSRVELKENSLKNFEKELGRSLENKDFHNHKNLNMKLKLWYIQGGTCLYSGKKIDVQTLVANPHYYEIDHIIPFSISHDDSQSNKVLVLSGENAMKSNKTPYMYLNNNGKAWDYEEFKTYVNKLPKELLSKSAKRNLLFEEDINRFDVQEKFRSRNLNDTRYACKVVLNTLQDYFKANEVETKIKVINGAYTYNYRRRLNLSKNRETHQHHGIDALICCYSKLGINEFEKRYIDYVNNNLKSVEDNEAEEVLFTFNTIDIMKEQLDIAEKNMKYSHKVDKKANRGLSKAKIYSTRIFDNVEYSIRKINIYSEEEIKIFKNVYEKDKSVFLMAKHDPKTFEIVEKIIETYGFGSDKKIVNPFIQYRNDDGPLRKYSKKGNGPEISTLKFCENKYNTGLDITHKYNDSKNRVFLTGRVPFRVDIYFDKVNNRFVTVRVDLIDCEYKKIDGKVCYILKDDIYNKKLDDCKAKKEDLEFKFHLYADDLIKINNGKGIDGVFRLGSFGKKDDGSLFVLKPLDAKEFEKFMGPTVGTFTEFVKVNTDILGEKHFTHKEHFKKEIKFY